MKQNAGQAAAARNSAARFILPLGLALFVVLLGHSLLTAGLTSIAQAAMLKSQSCPQSQFPCVSDPPGYFPIGWQADKTTLRSISETLALAQPLYGDDATLRQRRADIAFALGARADAATMTTNLPATCPQDTILADAEQQPVSVGKGYEKALLKAYQDMTAKNWSSSVECFRTAAMLGASFMSDGDRSAFFTTLGEYYAAQVEQSANPAQKAMLSGKSFARAGLADRANEELRLALSLQSWVDLSATEQTLIDFYFGDSAAAQHDQAGAAQAYNKAIGYDANQRLPRLALAMLGKQENGAQDAINWLATNGPTYALTSTLTTSSGAPQLVGYDLDEETLNDGPFVDAWLWWQSPAASDLVCNSCIVAGSYIIQKEALVNLMPNAGFEWPNHSSDGVPQGLIFSSNNYPGVVTNNVAASAPDQSDILTLTPTRANMRLDSFPTPVDKSAPYLISFWTQYQQADLSTGLICEDAADKSLAIITQNHNNKQASGAWTHVAQVRGKTSPEQIATCAVEFTAAYAAVSWDQLLIAKLPAGPQP